MLLRFGMKMLGAGFNIRAVNMDFHYKDLGEIEISDAYERLLRECVHGDATLYARVDAVEACWAFVTPILEAWRDNPDIKLYGYPSGTWSPKEASTLFAEDSEDWRYPSKSLVSGGDYIDFFPTDFLFFPH